MGFWSLSHSQGSDLLVVPSLWVPPLCPRSGWHRARRAASCLAPRWVSCEAPAASISTEQMVFGSKVCWCWPCSGHTLPGSVRFPVPSPARSPAALPTPPRAGQCRGWRLAAVLRTARAIQPVLVPCRCRLSSDLSNKAVRRGLPHCSPQPRAPAAERPRQPCREPSSAVTGRARPGRGSLVL